MPGALVLGGATSDRVTVTAAAAINNLDPMTLLTWIYPTTLSNNRMFGSKVNAGNTIGWIWLLTGGAPSKLQFNRYRATTGTNYKTPASTVTTSTWQMFATVYDSAAGAGNIVKHYRGVIGTDAVDVGNDGSPTDGSGANTDDSTYDLKVGNGVNDALAIQGSVAAFAVFGAALSLADIKSWQKRPRKTVGSNTAKLFQRFGKYGTDVFEYTGLTTAITGCSQGNGVPLDQGESVFERNPTTGLYQMSA